MDSTKARGFFLASFLVLMLLGDLTESCICVEKSLRQACCSAGFVMRAKFMNVVPDPNSPSYFPKNIYTIQPIKVFKGPEELERAQFLYSPIPHEYYGYVHKGPLNGDDYIFSGSIFHDRPIISMCNFAKPWSKVSSKKKKNLNNGKDCGTHCANL